MGVSSRLNEGIQILNRLLFLNLFTFHLSNLTFLFLARQLDNKQKITF